MADESIRIDGLYVLALGGEVASTHKNVQDALGALYITTAIMNAIEAFNRL